MTGDRTPTPRPDEVPDDDLMHVLVNALHGWHNPNCADCGKRALEVLDALAAHGYRIAKDPDQPKETR